MTRYSTTGPVRPVEPEQMRGGRLLKRMNTAGVSTTAPLKFTLRRFEENRLPDYVIRVPRAARIYLVDDEQGMTELYTLFLKGTGHGVQVFNHRTDALDSITADIKKPDLLITDFFCDAMPVDQFLKRCRVVHPPLRILMASGLSEHSLEYYSVRPVRFIQKPFTAEEFLREVSAALVG